jgi:hypothetical protein
LPDFDDSDWQTLQAPGFWEPQGVTEPRPGQAPQPADDRQMRYTDYDGVAWYRRQVVTVRPLGQGKPLVLRLGQVDDEDRSFVNGQLVGATGPGIERAVLRNRRYEVPPDFVRYGEDQHGRGAGHSIWADQAACRGRCSACCLRISDGQIDSTSRGRSAREGTVRGSARLGADPAHPPRLAGRFRGRSDVGPGRPRLAGSAAWRPTCRSRGYVEDPAAWQRLDPAIAAVREADGALWLYDEEGYPSGAAGGIVLRDHPEYEAQGLLCVDGVTSGEPLELTTPPGTIRAWRWPSPIGPRRSAVGPRRATRRAKANQPAFRTAAAGALARDDRRRGRVVRRHPCDFERIPGPASAEPAAGGSHRILPASHPRTLRRARYGKDLGRTFVSTFTDEPSLMAYFMKPMPYRPLPWSDTLAADYAVRWGEPLWPQLPLLYADGRGAERVRHRFWKLIGEQVSANYFGRIRRWCDAHGLRSGGHLLAEESLLAHVPFYGDFMACARQMTAPGIDVLTSLPQEVPLHGGKLVASAGELCGHTITMSEASDHSQRYRPQGDSRPVVQVTIDDIRGSLHRQQLSGINTFTSYYRFEPFAATDLVQLNAGIGRINTVMRGGHLVADIAVVYPIESVWPHYRPRVHRATDAPGAVAIEQAFHLTHRALFETGRDYCFVDTQGLLDAKVEGDCLTHGPLAWKVVVLPGVETLPQQAWDTLDAFQKAGGVLIAVGPRPKNSDTAFPSPAVQALDAAWFGSGGRGLALPAGQEALLPTVLDGVLERDVAWSPAGCAEGRSPQSRRP